MIAFLDQSLSNLRPALFLTVLFPVALLITSEALAAATRRNSIFTGLFRTLRNLVIPALALLIFVRLVLELPEDHLATRLSQTAFYLLLLFAILGVINDVVFVKAAPGSDSWRARVPKLFRDLVRALIVALGAMFIYSWVWGGEVKGAVAALGVGSIVIGLALQEPLGNIVSGLMLLFERPLNVGDWVKAEGVIGKVIEINWRSVHIESPTRELLIIPNVSLYKGAFSNLSRPTSVRTEVIEIGFSYDDPPNRVKEVMLNLLKSSPGVLSDPGPRVSTANYADFSITYRLVFSVAAQENLGSTRDAIMTRLWYVVRREGLNIPFPIAMEYSPGENPSAPPQAPEALLKSHPRFRPALAADTENPPRTVEFAAGETIQHPGSGFHGFALVLQGTAALLSKDASGQLVRIGEIGPGECFGDQLSAGAASHDVGVNAITDVVIMLFSNASIDQLLHRSPSLATEIGDAIESRRRTAQATRYRR